MLRVFMHIWHVWLLGCRSRSDERRHPVESRVHPLLTSNTDSPPPPTDLGPRSDILNASAPMRLLSAGLDPETPEGVDVLFFCFLFFGNCEDVWTAEARVFRFFSSSHSFHPCWSYRGLETPQQPPSPRSARAASYTQVIGRCGAKSATGWPIDCRGKGVEVREFGGVGGLLDSCCIISYKDASMHVTCTHTWTHTHTDACARLHPLKPQLSRDGNKDVAYWHVSLTVSLVLKVG